MMKKLMIPVAAFVVTVTGASAFNSDLLEKIDVDLSDSQITALEEAHELRIAGADKAEIKEVLEEADIDRDLLKEIRSAAKEVRKVTRAAVEAAVEANDYNAFLEAAPDRLTDAVNSEADFELFVEAKELKDAGDKEGARAILDELGIEKPDHKGKHGEGRGHGPKSGDQD